MNYTIHSLLLVEMEFNAVNERGVYSKPIIYTLLHVGYGYFAAFAPASIITFFIVWQLGQLLLDRRVFLLNWRVERGNSRAHTAKKFAEFIFGFAIGLLARQHSG
jgi:hypothetical protein